MNAIADIMEKQIKNRPCICLVFPSPADRPGESISIRINDLIKILQSSVEDIYIITRKDILTDITHEKVHFVSNLSCPSAGDPIPTVILGEIKAQLQIIRGIFSLENKVKLIFWRGRLSTVFIPLLLSKLQRKKAILLIESRGSDLVNRVYKGPFGYIGTVLTSIYKIVEKITFSSTDKLVVNVPGLLKQNWLQNYGDKVFPFPASIRFIEPSFKLSEAIIKRKPIVGYIGRMSNEKGILNLVHATPLVCNQIHDVEFLFGGDGPLRGQIENALKKHGTEQCSKMVGWIPHDELPLYLNKITLLVLPSDYEGLPTIVLESMACGTPVLATSVGAVPDLIIDGKTGFLMGNNSPECIAENVTRALNSPDLNLISQEAYTFAHSEYDYSVLMQRYADIISELINK